MTRVARLLVAVVVLCVMGSTIYGATLDVSITPNPGTANSIYIIEGTWKDNTASPMYPTTGGPPKGAGIIMVTGLGGPLGNSIPMHYVFGNIATSGAVYRAVISGGINLSNPLMQADRQVSIGGVNKYDYMPILGLPITNDGQDYYVTNKSWNDASGPSNLVPLADWGNFPVWYSPVLHGAWGAAIGGNKATFTISATAWPWDSANAKVSGTTPVTTTTTLVMYGSSHFTDLSSPAGIDYGWGGDTTWPYQMWVPGDMDYLTCYPDNLGAETVDPLNVIPTEYANDMTPDEGSGNSQYDFRIRYNSIDNALPPVPWFRTQGGYDSGVVLYFGRLDATDYDAYPMALETAGSGAGGVFGGIYKFSFVPAATNTFNVGQRTTKCYSTLEPGIYHYFFGTSDDSLYTLPNSDGSRGWTRVFDFQPKPDEWGGQSYGNSISGADAWDRLDPRGARTVTGFSDIDRLPGRRYSSGRIDPNNGTQPIRYDDSLFVDRVIRAPGVFEDDITWGFLPTPKYTRQYPFPCNEYPKVTCLIDMRNPKTLNFKDSDGLEFNDKKYGYDRYWGTMQPFKRGVFPILQNFPGTTSTQNDSDGATTQTENVFRIVYRQIDGKAPIKSQVWISNGLGRSGAKSYSMVPDDVLNEKNASLLTTADYKRGVWYSAKLKLPAGPHSYYFLFSDGLQTSNWPTRPDFDPWVGGAGIANDMVPGPYINTPAVLSEGAVTPGSGRQGVNFRYTIRYRDADGQRPYKGYVYIETSPGKVRQCEMLPLDKSQLTTTNIKGSGVVYYFDTSTVQDLVMESGQRRFYFEFSDDWGDPSNINDRIEGEKTRFPSATDSWMQGPEVVSNVAPRLTNGSVDSVDGSATPGTVWNFEVTYSDQNNDPPSSLKLYIGQLQRDTKTVIWDEGHAMLERDSTDTIYNDGKDYYFQTRLGGVDQSNDSDKQYYYAFYASDGELIATYRSSSDAALRSDAATSFYRQQLVEQTSPTADQYFKFEPKIAQRATVLSPYTAQLTDATDILTIAGVYASQDLAAGGGDNLYLDAGGNSSGFVNNIVTTKDPLPEIGSTVWVEYQPQSPIVGPVNIDQPATAGVLADAELFVGPTNDAALRIRLDGQKSGWTGETDGIDNTRFATMRGVASDVAGSPSSITVVPEFPDMIASVEGVYLIPADDTTDPFTGTNYYVPTTASHFHAGDKLIPLTGFAVADAGKSVLIKYSDIRFTYIQRGVGQNETPSPVDGSYNSYYVPDSGINAYIKGNNGVGVDVTSGLVGVWLNTQRELSNYFDPWVTSYAAVKPGSLSRVLLTNELPAGTGNVYGRYYQDGEYHIDRANRSVYTLSAIPGQNVYATYMFGKRMPVLVGKNTAPTLTGGNVSTYRGSRTTQFIYSVNYTDIDGPNGQQPSYVRVYVDGVAHDMLRESVGTPDYKQGARYLYYTTIGTAGSHTFHFEASDGTASAIYDWYNVNNQTRPSTGQRVREIDGPWINDPPVLSGVTMNPTPTAKLGQVVDISVNYTDVDNDEPYFFDAKKDIKDDGTALGLAVSRSPRLWIGSGADPTTTYVEGTIDSVSSTDKRVFNITLDSGYTVTADSLVNNYLQIIPKDQQDYAGRLYLVTANSTTTLQVRTKDATVDGVIAGDRFRINGILMRKTDATDTNYTDGVNYTITLPTLPEGAYKMQITARSREDKPAWLKTAMAKNGEQWLPYSDPAAETAITALTQLVLQRPDGNSAPILTGTVGNTVSQGMTIKGTKIALQHKTNVLSATKIGLWDVDGEPYNRLFVTNVYRYADSMYKDAADRTASDGYFTPASPPRNYDQVLSTVTGSTVSTEITLSKAFDPILPTTALVQLVTIDEFAKLALPDSISSIGTVIGIYSDPEGTNQINDGTTMDANGRIKISSIPANLKMNSKGKKIAFLKYNPVTSTLRNVPISSVGTQITPTDVNVMPSIAGIVGVYAGSDTAMTGTNYYDTSNAFTPGNVSIRLTSAIAETRVNIKYVPYSPVYVEYRGGHVEGTADADRLLASGVPVMLSCDYRDADNDPPAFHDNVEGFMLVDLFNATHTEKQFPFTMPQPEPQNFTSNVRFEQIFPTGPTASMLVPGVSTYSFVGSDGYAASADYVWLPAKIPNGYKMFINQLPTLTGGAVLSLGRDTTDTTKMDFALSVIYTDLDGQAPGFVTARIKHEDGTVEDRTLTKESGTPNYKTGVVFNGNVTLAVGTYSVVFETTDGIQNVDTLAFAKQVIVSGQNSPPVIHSYALNKAFGKLDSTFVFTANYSDVDGDSPLVSVGSVAQEGMKLIVTETTSNKTKEFVMSRVGSSINYRDGVNYSASVTGSALQTALGWSGKTNYVFTVTANDGVVDALKTGLPATKAGPVLNIPYIKTMSVVDKDSGETVTRTAAGREVLLKGTIAFPWDGTSSSPSVSDIRLIVAVPGGASIGIPVNISSYSLVTGTYKKEWIGTISPDYANAEPNQDPAVASGTSIKLTTGGDWTFKVTWSGDTVWDTLIVDANLDGANDSPDYAVLSVGGPMRTIAVADPGLPSTSKPLVDMFTPPMYIGNPLTADAGFVFGYQHAADMQIVRWDPASKTYKKYSISSPLELSPGDAVWAKPLDKYPVELVSSSDIASGLLMSGNLGITLDPAIQYRVISVSARDYPVQTDSNGKPVTDRITGKVKIQPCTIALKAGWNQFGNIFYNWKTDSSGTIVTPRVDLGIAMSTLTVSYLGVTKTLADARAAGWVRDYAWRYDAESAKYVLVSATATDAEKVLHIWSGYWIRALVDCSLIIDPNTTEMGTTSKVKKTQKAGVLSIGTNGSGNSSNLDVPPPPAFEE